MVIGSDPSGPVAHQQGRRRIVGDRRGAADKDVAAGRREPGQRGLRRVADLLADMGGH
jgi:hypothetical protein